MFYFFPWRRHRKEEKKKRAPSPRTFQQHLHCFSQSCSNPSGLQPVYRTQRFSPHRSQRSGFWETPAAPGRPARGSWGPLGWGRFWAACWRRSSSQRARQRRSYFSASGHRKQFWLNPTEYLGHKTIKTDVLRFCLALEGAVSYFLVESVPGFPQQQSDHPLHLIWATEHTAVSQTVTVRAVLRSERPTINRNTLQQRLPVTLSYSIYQHERARTDLRSDLFGQTVVNQLHQINGTVYDSSYYLKKKKISLHSKFISNINISKFIWELLIYNLITEKHSGLWQLFCCWDQHTNR